MAVEITHAKIYNIPDGIDPNKLQPSHWHAAHVITGLPSEVAHSQHLVYRVVGYSVDGLPDINTQILIDGLLLDGISPNNIDWIDIGEAESGGLFGLSFPILTSSIEGLLLECSGGTFLAADAASAGAIETILLDLNSGEFVVANALSGSAIDTFSITDATILTFDVSSLLSGSTLGEIELYTVLSSQDLLSASTIEEVILALSGGTYAVDSLVSTSTLGEFALVAPNIFTIANMTTVSSFSDIALTFVDAQAPIITTWSPGTTSTMDITVTTSTLVASDNVAVTGYLINESATAVAGDFVAGNGYSATLPLTYTSATAGTRTLYAHVMDAAGFVADSSSSSVSFSAGGGPTLVFEDAFSGANGDAPNPAVWALTQTLARDSNSKTEIYNGTVRTGGLGTKGEGMVTISTITASYPFTIEYDSFVSTAVVNNAVRVSNVGNSANFGMLTQTTLGGAVQNLWAQVTGGAADWSGAQSYDVNWNPETYEIDDEGYITTYPSLMTCASTLNANNNFKTKFFSNGRVEAYVNGVLMGRTIITVGMFGASSAEFTIAFNKEASTTPTPLYAAIDNLKVYSGV